jgi:hypothetical protein
MMIRLTILWDVEMSVEKHPEKPVNFLAKVRYKNCFKNFLKKCVAIFKHLTKNGFLSCSPGEQQQQQRKLFIDFSSSAGGFGRTRESIVHSCFVRYV